MDLVFILLFPGVHTFSVVFILYKDPDFGSEMFLTSKTALGKHEIIAFDDLSVTVRCVIYMVAPL